jgi:His-Xaa-Ser system radical SAM maturase HxsB
MARQFRHYEEFRPPFETFQLLPFRFTRLDEKELLVNEVGEYLIVPTGTVRTLLEKKIDLDSALYRDLKAKQFLFDPSSSPLLDVLATKYRTKYSHIYGGTKLHIFVVTLRCEHTCHYCQVSRQTTARGEYDMSEATADRAISLMMDSPSQHLTLELQGGEPLLAFDLIRYIVPRAKQEAALHGKSLDIVVTTNLACVTDEMIAYFAEEEIKISTSLDGPEFLHNRNRPRPGGNSYERAIAGIQRCRDILGPDRVAALMTTTSASLDHVIPIIDEYVRLQFHTIFLRPISPYGFALKTQHRTGYEMTSFLSFFKKGLAHILEINKGGYQLAEIYTQILLQKILTPYGTGYVDLQSPAGAALNVLVYNYNGDIFASDESRMLAEMRDLTFKLGNVHTDSRASLFTSDAALTMFRASCNQTLPGCSDCAFQTYCGSDPIYHHATQGDMVGHRPTSGFCNRNMEVIRHLFRILEENDPHVLSIFWSWITGASVELGDKTCG